MVIQAPYTDLLIKNPAKGLGVKHWQMQKKKLREAKRYINMKALYVLFLPFLLVSACSSLPEGDHGANGTPTKISEDRQKLFSNEYYASLEAQKKALEILLRIVQLPDPVNKDEIYGMVMENGDIRDNPFLGNYLSTCVGNLLLLAVINENPVFQKTAIMLNDHIAELPDTRSLLYSTRFHECEKQLQFFEEFFQKEDLNAYSAMRLLSKEELVDIEKQVYIFMKKVLMDSSVGRYDKNDYPEDYDIIWLGASEERILQFKSEIELYCRQITDPKDEIRVILCSLNGILFALAFNLRDPHEFDVIVYPYLKKLTDSNTKLSDFFFYTVRKCYYIDGGGSLTICTLMAKKAEKGNYSSKLFDEFDLSHYADEEY